jgi:hypothetical protein
MFSFLFCLRPSSINTHLLSCSHVSLLRWHATLLTAYIFNVICRLRARVSSSIYVSICIQVSHGKLLLCTRRKRVINTRVHQRNSQVHYTRQLTIKLYYNIDKKQQLPSFLGKKSHTRVQWPRAKIILCFRGHKCVACHFWRARICSQT